MTDNKGNNYRIRNTVVFAGALIALAVGLLIVGLANLAWINLLWIFMLVFGIVLAVVGTTYNSTPDKFGPSEQIYRIAIGALLALFGLIGLLWSNACTEYYICLAVLLIGIAVIGLAVALSNHKTSKF
jgi:hypothetical protein